MKRAQVWLLLSTIGVGAVFGLARGQVEKEAFLNQPVRDTCKLEHCVEGAKVVPLRQQGTLEK
jgi:hypothetical protein